MDRSKIIKKSLLRIYFFLLIVLLFAYPVQSQEFDKFKSEHFDPSFHDYLNKIRISCLQKDTSILHQLFGDTILGWSCYGLEGINQDYPNDWETFKASFDLINQIENSNFWELFLKLSDNSFYYDSISGFYEIPSFHFWGNGYFEGAPKPGFYDLIYADTINLFVGNQLSDLKPKQFVPEKITRFKKYPYHFKRINTDYHEIFENDKSLGYISSKDLIYYDLHFSFKKRGEFWSLVAYTICD